MSTTPTRRYSPRRPRTERREQLLDAALSLVDAHGLSAFSIEGVARGAGLTKSVVYATFGSGEELLRALLDRELQRALADIAAALPQPPHSSPGAMLSDSLAIILRAVRERPETWRLFVLPADGMPSAVREDVARHRAELIEQVRPPIEWSLSRLSAEHVDAEVMTEMIIACFEHAARMALTAPERFTSERLLAFASDFVATHRAR
ncbi:MAG TPA: TetR/AcrR family transcriptional regulator [Solirubrobacteraceae bacterium]|jgi:AcrR family transcriptional regulator|nr:TetR/AcrR family transcriptional regulator [Solirubrobacteraceae bacterium]